jgi:hypothetical protein
MTNLRLRVRQRPEQEGVDHREHCRCRADAERERDDRRHAEARRFDQLPKRVAKISHGWTLENLL